jgi:hypothetical protein
MTRRRFLTATVVVGGGTAAWTLRRRGGARLPFGYLLTLSRDRRNAVRRVTAHLDEVSFSAECLNDWMDAFDRAVGEVPRPTTRRKARKLARQLLASTDFFQTGMNTERPAEFVALWSPKISPCYNPFAR